MVRSIFGIRWNQIFGDRMPGSRRERRRPRARQSLAIESLEQRALLANIIPSAVISSTPNGSDLNYSIERRPRQKTAVASRASPPRKQKTLAQRDRALSGGDGERSEGHEQVQNAAALRS